MPLIQFLILAFAVFALWRTVSRFKEGAFGRVALAAWLMFWLAVIAAAALPQSTNWFASLVGVGRGVDAVIYVSIIVLFYSLFRLLIKMEKMEHNITLLVREIGLHEMKNKTSGSKDEVKKDLSLPQ